MLMIATVIPVTGTLQESEQKNSVLNQNNKTVMVELNRGIGFITNRTYLGNGVISFNCIFFLYMDHTMKPVWDIRLYHSHEYLEVEKGGIHFHNYTIRFIGKHFAFFIHREYISQ